MPERNPSESCTPIVLEYHRGHLVSKLLSGQDARDGAATSSQQAAAQPRGLASVAASTLSVLRAAFLPEGFPDSVTPDYLGFQAWDTVQALSSYVRGMLTSAAILRGVGVGQQVSTPLAAVFTFFLRDLAGMLGGILFAYLEGSGFDSCAKQWRLFADITNDVGMTLELASPLLPRAMFLPIACAGSVARSVTGVAGGATRAALTQHFAVRGNAADVAAKEQSQETATTILGMLLGMALTRALSAHPPPPSSASSASSSSFSAAASVVAAWLVFGSLTALHVGANVAALRCLLLRSLNRPRAEALVRRYLLDGRVLTPRQLAACEDLTPPPFRRLLDALSGAARRRPVQLHWGSRLAAVLPHASLAGRGLDGLLERHSGRRYLLVTAAFRPPASASALAPTTSTARAGAAASGASRRRGSGSGSRYHVHVVLSASATPPDMLCAFVHAHVLASELAAAAAGRATARAPPAGGEDGGARRARGCV